MFYDVFLQLCKRNNTTPSAVTQAIGLNKSSASYWKRGSIPSDKTLEKIAAYFNVSRDYLLDNENKEEFLTLDGEAPVELSEYEINEWKKEHEHILSSPDYEKNNHMSLDVRVRFGDNAFESMMYQVSDTFFRDGIIGYFDKLNRRGRIEAYFRLYELTQIKRFTRPGNKTETPPEE